MKPSPGKRLLYIIQKSDTKPIEFVSFILILAWGLLILFAPAPSLTGASFRILSDLMPEHAWGLIAVVIGLLALYGLLYDGHSFRYWMLFAKSIFWACLAAGTILGNYSAPAWLFYVVLALSSGWAFIRLRDSTDEWVK